MIENDCLHDLSDHKRHQLLRGLPELPVDETGGEAAHECEQFCLPWTDLDDTRLEGRKGLLDHSSVVIRVMPPPSAMSTAKSVFTAGGMSSITSTPVSSN